NNDKKPGLSWSTPASSNTSSAIKQPSSNSLNLPKMSPNNGNATARYAGIFVGGLIVGVVFAWGWSAITHKNDAVATSSTSTVATTNGTTSSTKTSSTKTAATTNTKATAAANTSVAGSVVLGNAELTITSPQKAGQSVAVSKVEVSKPTWVVVYDDNNGTPGNVLGAQLFFSTGSGTVTLLRPTMAGKSYLVGRSIDNGDHKFQKASDQVVVDATGAPILATLTAN
ncbi:MAG TPA: hypothetical protein VIY48_14355, partial [Candidatus Paceibacterota bacterium]